MSVDEQKIDPEMYLGALEPYFELVKIEYSNERDRKNGLDTRGGIIITAMVAMSTIIFSKIKIIDILNILSAQLTFLLFIKIVNGLLIYLSFLGCIIFSFKTIHTADYATFEVGNISSQVLGTRKNVALGHIIIAYRDIISENRIVNDKKAKMLNSAIKCMAGCSIAICIFLNL